MNPCPCGYLGHATRACRCTPDGIARYQGKISGPLLDRIDLQIQVAALTEEELMRSNEEESSTQIAERVVLARDKQYQRQGKANAQLGVADITQFCQPTNDAEKLLRDAIRRLNWSARAYHRVLKVARTIADLAHADQIDAQHIAVAIQYRRALPHLH